MFINGANKIIKKSKSDAAGRIPARQEDQPCNTPARWKPSILNSGHHFSPKSAFSSQQPLLLLSKPIQRLLCASSLTWHIVGKIRLSFTSPLLCPVGDYNTTYPVAVADSVSPNERNPPPKTAPGTLLLAASALYIDCHLLSWIRSLPFFIFRTIRCLYTLLSAGIRHSFLHSASFDICSTPLSIRIELRQFDIA